MFVPSQNTASPSSSTNTQVLKMLTPLPDYEDATLEMIEPARKSSLMPPTLSGATTFYFQPIKGAEGCGFIFSHPPSPGTLLDLNYRYVEDSQVKTPELQELVIPLPEDRTPSASESIELTEGTTFEASEASDYEEQEPPKTRLQQWIEGEISTHDILGSSGNMTPSEDSHISISGTSVHESEQEDPANPNTEDEANQFARGVLEEMADRLAREELRFWFE